MNKTGSKILHGLLLATSGLVGSTLIASTAAMAGGGPTGGKVAVGSATIVNASPTQTVVNQSSKKALINWNSFSIPSGSSVKFNQPTSKSLAVNRVTGPNASAIDGQLLANGNVWLINANGVLFGKGSQVNVGALLATTSDLSDDDFKAGNYNFKSAANPNAAVVNKGTITAGANGSVVLSAPRVSNEGLIRADVGTVVLGGAKAFTVDMTGDNLLRYEITAPVTDAPRDENGNVATALVSNSGKILAAGGQVMMTARAARNIENNVINNTGMVEATTVSSHNGEIDLDAGPDGTVNDSGTLNATGAAQGQTGGTVNVTGGTVSVADGAKIDASGNAGGGTVQIGGGLHGQGTLAHAQRTIIGGATITADATGKGNGGTVAVWSDGATSFSGTISAKGGAKGGNGGQVETSGHTLGVASSAKVDTTAPLGLTGDWLLDPTDLVITSCVSGQACCGSATCVDSSSIATNLGTTDITETASNSLTVDTNSDIAWNSAHSLSLLSQGDIDINSNIQNAGSGGINIVAGWDGTTLNFSPTMASTVYGVGGVGDINIDAAAGSIAIGSAGGQTIVAGHTIELHASNGTYAQIGYHGAGGGNIAVLAGGDLSLFGGSDSSEAAQIGNGVADGSVNGNVGGDIFVDVAGVATINQSNGYAYLGNIAAQGSTETGDVTVITNGGALYGDYFVNDLGTGVGTGGNVFVGFTGTSGDYTLAGLDSYDSANAFTYAAAANLDVIGSVLNSGTGAINLVAGWDGHTTDLASLFSPDVANATTYGNNQGAVTISAGEDGGPVSVGSAGGKTSVAGYSVTLDGTYGLSQIGYYGTGGGDILVLSNTDVSLDAGVLDGGWFAQIGNGGDGSGTTGNTGNITVVAGGDVMLTGGEGSYYAQIGNGGVGLAATASGNISVNAIGDITLEGYSGPNADTGYALIGNGGFDFSGNISGNIVVQAGGDVSLLGGDEAGYAQIGNSSPTDDCGCDPSGDISVTAAGAVTLSGGDGDFAYAQIGNGGAESGSALNAGNITIITGDDLTLNGGGGELAYAQIGNGGDGAGGISSGNITVNVTGSISLSGNEDYAQIGNGGYGVYDDSNGTISVSATGNIDLYGYSDTSYGYAQIGNGGKDSEGINSGDIVVSALGSISLIGDDAYAQIGNGGDGSYSSSGNITVSAGSNSTLADLTLSAGADGYALIGNGGYADGDVSGDIAVTVSGTTYFESDEEGAEAWIGNITGGEGGAATGNVRIITGDINTEDDGRHDLQGLILSDVMGGNVTIGTTDASKLSTIDDDLSYASANTLTFLSAGDFEISSHIQNNGTGAINLVAGWDGQTTNLGALTNAGVYGNNSGSITIDGTSQDASVGSASGKTTVLGYDIHLTGGAAHTQIGYNGAATGNISVLAKHDITLSGGTGSNGSYGYAQIGNGGAFVVGPDSGNISVNAGNNITLTGGTGTYSYASIGNGGDTDAHNSSGDIAVTAGGSIALLGGTDFAQIGNGQWGSNGSSGNIAVTAAQNITLTGASNSPWGYALIGNGGQYATGTMSGNISVAAGGTLALTAGNNGMYAQIGNGGDKGSSQNSASGNISVAAGNLTLTGASNVGSREGYAAIGNSAIYNSGVAGSGVASGNIAINVSGTTKVVSTDGQGDAWIGHATTPGGSQSGSVTVITHNLDDSADNNDDIGQFVVSDLSGGAVTFGITNAAATNTIGGLNYTSSNALTILSAGNITVSGGIKNAGTGNITLGAGWNPAVLPANLSTASNAYNNASASLAVSNVTTGGNLVLGSGGSISQSGAISAQNLAVTARGAIALGNTGNRFTTASLSSGGNASLYDATSLTISGASIGGNLALSSGGSIGQSGAISAQGLTVTASSAIALNNTGNRFTTASLSSGGNASLYDANSLTISGASIGGDLALSSGGSIGQSGAISAQGFTVTASGAIALNNTGNRFTTASLSSGGNVSVYDANSLTISGASVSGDLALSSGGSIGQSGAISAQALALTASGAIALNNSGNHFTTASWSSGGDVSLYDAAALTIHGAAYSNASSLTLGSGGDIVFDGSVQNSGTGNISIVSAGNIVIGGATASSGVAVGSQGGVTTFTAGNLLLSAVNGYAQLGYHGAGSGAIIATLSGNVTLTGGGATGYYTQIGNGGYNVAGSSNAAISVTASGQIALNGGAGQEAYAQIGNGGAESNSNSGGYSETGLVTVSGEIVLLQAGSGTGSYAQIGHGGYKSGQSLNGTATLGGDVTVNAANAIRLVGGGLDAYAQIGQGGNFLNNGAANGSGGTISGNIAVAVAAPNTHNGNDPLTLTAGTGANSFAQIGNGGQGENKPAAGATVNFVISGNVTVADLTLTGSNTGANGYAQIGNGDASKTGTGNVSGQVTLGQGTDITYIPGTAPGASTGLGNATGAGTVTGTLPAGSVNAGTQGSVASITKNTTGPDAFNLQLVSVTPSITSFNFSSQSSPSKGLTPLEQLADNSNSEGQVASDSVAQSVGQSLGEGKTIYITSKTLIPGMLKQIVTLTRNNPTGIPPADEDYSSWGNEALWRW